jgi:hypothetical protein
MLKKIRKEALLDLEGFIYILGGLEASISRADMFVYFSFILRKQFSFSK